MCGICGVVELSQDNLRGLPPGGIEPMLQKLRHRGPQGASIASSGAATFGTQRLAIRGLDDGLQPVFDKDSGVIAVCNGEIDNHRELRTVLAQRGRYVLQATDIAVLPALYLEFGEDFIEKLIGVFTVALWDPRQEKLIMARDRAGERSLFYHRQDRTVSFATEVAALAAGTPGLTTDVEAIAGYLARGCFIAPSSPLRGVEKVRPGEIVAITAQSVRKQFYWRWPAGEAPKRKPSVNVFDEIFRGAVLRQSNIDVDFGLFLSGGVDSSLVAAVVSDLYPERRPPCYTLRFSETSYDEGCAATQVARDLSLEMISVPVTPEMFAAGLPRLVGAVGEPLADPAWIPTAMLARRAARDVRIVFTGEGGDELFGGYPTYLAAGLAQRFDRLPAPLRKSLSSMVNTLPSSERKMPLSFLLKRFVAGAGQEPFTRHVFWTANIGPDLLGRLGVAALAPVQESFLEGADLLDQLQKHDLETTLAEGLLTKADRGGMSESLEIRAPFLDYNVMAFAASLPANERVRGLTTKHFLKRYARRYLPANIVHRRKRGLSIPLVSWLRGPLYDWAQKRLQAGRLARAGIDPDVALALFDEHREKRANYARPLWALLVLDEWLAWKDGSERAYAGSALLERQYSQSFVGI